MSLEEQYYSDLKKLRDECVSIIYKLADKYGKLLEEDLYRMAHMKIEKEFYDAYDRRSYHPKWDLHNAVNIEINRDIWHFEMDPRYMTSHGIYNEYIYENSLVKGYHGGADRTSNEDYPHPEPGVPYWKVPTEFKAWLSPAAKTKENIEKDIAEEANDLIRMYEEICDNNIYQQCQKKISAFKTKYKDVI